MSTTKKFTQEEFEQYLMEKHSSNTLTELSAQTGRTYDTVKKKCIALGIVPITSGERIENIIKENQHVTFDEMCALTDLSAPGLKPYLSKLGIVLEKKIKPRVTNKQKEIEERKKKEAVAKIENIGKVVDKMKMGELKSKGLLGPIASKYIDTMSLLEASNKLRHGV